MAEDVKIQLLVEAVDQASRVFNTVKQQLDSVGVSARGATKSTKALGDAGDRAGKQYSDSLKGANEQMERLRKTSMDATQAGMALIGVGATLSATAFFPIKAAGEFEKAMSQVKAVTTGADENFEALTESASELGRTTKYTASEAAAGMQFLGRAGFDANEVISAIGPSLSLAAAGALDLASAADISSNVVAGFNLETGDLSHVVDVLANTAASANTNIQQLGDAMKMAGPLAAASGVSIDQAAAAVGVLSDAGLQATLAGTQLRGVLAVLAKPSQQASEALQRLGVQVAFSDDGMVDLSETMRRLGEANLGMADAVTIFNRRQAAGALILSKQVDKLDDLTKANERATGRAKEMQETMEENLFGAVTKLSSAFDGLARAVAGPLLAPISAVIKAVTSLVSSMAELANQFPILSGAVLGVIGVLGALLTVLGTLALAFGGLSFAISSVMGLPVVAAATAWIASFVAMTAAVGTLGAVASVTLGILSGFVTILAGIGTLLLSPFVAAAAAVVGLTAYLTSASDATAKEVEEVEKLSEALGQQTDKWDALLARYEDYEQGSEDAKRAAKEMVKELQAVADENEELEEVALAAAKSIHVQSGRLLDGGIALKKYKDALVDAQAVAFDKQAALLSTQLKEVQKEGSMATQVVHSLTRAWRFWAGVAGEGSGSDAFKQEEEEIRAAREELKAFTQEYIGSMTDLGKIDISMPLTHFTHLIKQLPNVSEEAVSIMIAEFKKLKSAAEDTAKATDEVFKTRAEVEGALEKRVASQVASLTELKNKYDNARDAALDAETAFSMGKIDKDQFATVIESAAAAGKAYKEGQTESTTVLMAETSKRSRILTDTATEEIAAIQRKEKLKQITTAQSEEAILVIEQMSMQKKEELWAGELDRLRSSGLAGTEIYQKALTARENAEANTIAKTQELNDFRVIQANETAQQILKITGDTEKIRIGLMKDNVKKLEAQMSLEIKAFADGEEAKLLTAKQVAERIALIRKKYGDKQAQEIAQRGQIIKAAEVAAAQKRAQASIATLKDKFSKGHMAVKDFVRQTLDAELAIIDEKMAEIKNKLNDPSLTSTQKMTLEFEVKGLEGDRTQAMTDAHGTEMALLEDRRDKELQIDDEINQYKINNQMAATTSMEERQKLEMDLFDINTRTKMQATADAGATIDQQDEMFMLRQVERRQKLAAQEEALRDLQLNAAQTAAGGMASAMGDMYEATGKKVKEFFYVQQAAAIAETIISTYQGAQNAYTNALLIPYVGIYLAPVMAAAAIMGGMARVAMIKSQKMATGGEVEGHSPTDSADNVPIWATAGEYIIPVKSAKKYGSRVLEGIRQGTYPKAMFENFSVPLSPMRTSSLAMAAGGSVPKAAPKAEAKQEQAPINITNVVDPAMLEQHLASRPGQRNVMNVLTQNSFQLKQILMSED